jgi:hypothetical protein
VTALPPKNAASDKNTKVAFRISWTKDSHNNNCLTSLVHLAPKTNNLRLTKIQMAYNYIIVIRRLSKSTAIASDFQNSLLFSLFSGNLGTASLRRIGGESAGAAIRR